MKSKDYKNTVDNNAKKRNVQANRFEYYSDHEIGKDLKVISEFLDQYAVFVDWVAESVQVDIDEVNALIERVEYALEHDLSVSSEDLRLLLDLALDFNSRLNNQQSTIDKLRKLAGLVNRGESGKRDANGKAKRAGTRKG